MADTWGSVPYSALDDERLDGDSGPTRAFFALVMLACDDHGLFEGDAPAFARRFGCDPQWVEDGFAEIESRGLVERYEAPGRRRKVGRVIGYHDFGGHVERKAYPSQRTASLYPDKSGDIIPGKDGRKRKDSGSQADKSPASKPQVGRKSGASDAQPASKSGASKPQGPRKTEEKRGEEKRRDPRATHSERGATSAPPQPSPPGSTDARAIGSPDEGVSPPALLGAGGTQGETWGDDYSQPDPNPPPPPPPPRPPPMTREQELERRRYLREQLAAIEALDAAAKGAGVPA